MTRNAAAYLNPPIKNFASTGIQRLSKEIVTWLDIAPNPADDLALTARLMDEAGTGGAIFRNLYRDFLKEAAAITGDANVERAYALFCEIAAAWTQVSALIAMAGQQGAQAHLREASDIVRHLASQEQQAMTHLAELA
jgi:hypothetical protein